MSKTAGTITVYSGPALLQSRWQPRSIPHGPTLQDIVNDVGYGLYPAHTLVVCIQAQRVPSYCWPRVRPRAGTICHVVRLPLGSDGQVNKETLRLLAGVGSALAGVAVPGLLGLSGVAEWAVRAGIMLGGFWAINTFMPVSNDETKSYSFSGSRNRLAPYDPVPRLYGKMRIYPPLAAQPVTEVSGNDHYLRLLFCLGYRPLIVDEGTLKFGEIPLNRLSDYEYEIRDGWGWPDRNDPPFTLYLNDTFEELMEHELFYTDVWVRDDRTPPEVHENVVTLVTQARTQEISLDIVFPEGLGYQSGGGGLQSHSVNFHIQYRLWSSYVDAELEADEGYSPWIDVVPSWATEIYPGTPYDISEATILNWLGANLVNLDDTINDLMDDIEAFAGNKAVPVELAEQLDQLTATPGGDIRSAINNIEAFDEVTVPQQTACDEAEATRARVRPVQANRFIGDQFPDADYGQLVTRLHLAMQMYLVLLRMEKYYASNNGFWPDAPADFTSDWDLFREFLSLVEHFSDIFTGDEWVGTGVFTISNSGTRGIIRRNVTWRPPQAGKYEVRVRRASDEAGEGYLEKPVVAAFRSIKLINPVSTEALEKYAFLALRIKASDQLSGVADAFSCVAESPLMYTEDGVTWLGPAFRDSTARRVSRNPAWALADIIIGAANKQPADMSRLDGARLLEFAEWCYDNEYHFDHLFDRSTTVQRAMEDVCRVAKASPTLRDGLYSVVQDKPQTTDVAVIALRNSNRFMASKSMTPRPQALRVKFLNPARDWITDEQVVYEDGYGIPGSGLAVPDLVEELDVPGLVDVPEDPTHPYHSGQVYRLGRYLLAVNRLRTEIYTADLDYEHLIFERGDQIQTTIDVVQWGLGSARVVAVTRDESDDIETVALDQSIEMTDGQTYQMRFRNKRGKLTDAGTLVTDDELPVEVEFATPLDDTVDGVDVAAGDLAIWGLVDAISEACIVRDVQPTSELGAQVTLIPATPEVHDADSEALPVYAGSALALASTTSEPPPPALGSVTADSVSILIDVAVRPGANIATIEAQYRAAASLTGTAVYLRAQQDWTSTGVFPATLRRITFAPVDAGQTYDIRVRAVTRDGVFSEWRPRFGIAVPAA